MSALPPSRALGRLATLCVLCAAGTAAAQADPPPPPGFTASDAQARRAEVAQVTDAPARTTGRTGASEAVPERTDEGWRSDWALLFALNNILVNGSFLSSNAAGSVAFSYFLSPQSALRTGLSLTRLNGPVHVTTVRTTTGPDSFTTYQVTNPAGFTDLISGGVRSDYLRRMSTAAIAPYAGVGLQLNLSLNRQNYLDELTVVDQRTELDNNTTTFDLTARGILGAEWRVHPNFAVYAEYVLSVAVISSSWLNNRTTIENSAGGTPTTTQTETERTVQSFLNVSAGLGQGASLGLQVFF